jgi:hypothetical protein
MKILDKDKLVMPEAERRREKSLMTSAAGRSQSRRQARRGSSICDRSRDDRRNGRLDGYVRAAD